MSDVRVSMHKGGFRQHAINVQKLFAFILLAKFDCTCSSEGRGNSSNYTDWLQVYTQRNHWKYIEISNKSEINYM